MTIRNDRSMKLQKRNLKPVYYAKYEGQTPILDSDGYETGEYKIVYSSPKMVMANVSPGTGYIKHMPFGNLPSWDRIIIVDDIYCDMDETSILAIDEGIDPSFDPDALAYEYTVTRKALSLNYVAYAIKKMPKVVAEDESEDYSS